MAELALILPFFFVFAITYGSLEVSKIFHNNAVKAIISLVLATFAATNENFIILMNQIFPHAVTLFVAVFFIGFIFALVKGKGEKGKSIDYVLLIIIAGLILLLLASQGDLVEFMNSINSDFLAYAGLILIGIILFAAYKQPKES